VLVCGVLWSCVSALVCVRLEMLSFAHKRAQFCHESTSKHLVYVQ